MSIVEKLLSQIGDDVRVILDRDALLRDAADAISGLRAFAAHVEQTTATGDGLSPDDIAALHLMAQDALREQKP